MGLSLVGSADAAHEDATPVESLGGRTGQTDGHEGGRQDYGGGERDDIVMVRDIVSTRCEMIRGKKGSHLDCSDPADATDPSSARAVELVRDEIKLKDQKRAGHHY